LKEKKSTHKAKRRHNKNMNGPAYIYDTAVHRAMCSYTGRSGLVRNFFRWIDVYRKPRLLTGGPAGSGKTALVARSGLPYDFIYPDSHQPSAKHEMPGWFFSDRAVYIDTPGALSIPERWSAFCSALKKHRFGRRRAVDGLLFVIDIREFLSMDPPRAGKLASDLREQADILISTTGYNVPVCFIFSKLDRLDGAREFLGDESMAERMPALGALFGDDDSDPHPAESFTSCYQKIYDDVSDLCVLKMIGTEDAGKNRPLCRFLSELTLAGPQISAFFAEFIRRPAPVVPRIGGFFMASAHNRGRVLGDIIPQANFRIKEAGAGTPGFWAKKIAFHLLMVMICAAAVFGIAGSGLRDALHMRTLKTELSLLLEGDPSVENQYAALEKLRLSYDYLQGAAKSPGRLIFGTDKARKRVMDAYIAASWQVMAGPAARYLESSIPQQGAGKMGELTSEEHQRLYHDLKTYLLLTNGNSVKIDDAAPVFEAFELSLKNSLGRRYHSIDENIVLDNINTVIKLAAGGHYKDRTDKNIVLTARRKLAAAPRAIAVYASVMDRLNAQRREVPIVQIIGGNELLRYGRGVSALYTRDGWEQTVYAELVNASKDPFRADWVMGPVAGRTDEAALLSELVSLYGDDLCRRWLDFIRNVHVSLPADIPSLARELERLSSRNSETRRMLAAVCSLAAQKPADLTAPKTSPVSVGAIKGQIANVSNKLRGGVRNLTHDVPDPFVDARKIFDPLEMFLTGGGFDAYIGTLSELSEKLKQCDDRGAFAPVFLVRGDDPVKTSRNALAKAGAAMPPALSASLKRVLESPLDITAGLLAGKISAELEDSWSAEVVAHFNVRLAPRNPFNRSGADLSWNDFEEFFRPPGGVLWAYQNKNLQGLMERTPKGWARVPARSLSVRVSINDDVVNAYNRAEKIVGGFFRSDGVPKRQNNMFYPFNSSVSVTPPPQSGSDAMSSEVAMRGFAVPEKVLRD